MSLDLATTLRETARARPDEQEEVTVTVADTVEATLEQDFRFACLELATALDEQRRKDTPGARARVARCRAGVDRVLDLRNAARR